HARILHHLVVDLVALSARGVHDPRKHHRLALFQVHALRKGSDLAGLDILGDTFAVFQRAMLAPDGAAFGRNLAVGLYIRRGQGQYETIYISHDILLGSATFEFRMSMRFHMPYVELTYRPHFHAAMPGGRNGAGQAYRLVQ